MFSSQNTQVIDLTHPLQPGIPVWPGDPEWSQQPASSLQQDGFYLNKIDFGEHTGTHIGAPAHFNQQGLDAAQIPAEHLVIPGVKISIPEPLSPERLLSAQNIQEWERINGTIPPDIAVLIETGWSRYWNNPEQYLGRDNAGLHFPGVSLPAMEFLVQKRKIRSIGIDTAGIDGGVSLDFSASIMAAHHNVYHLENLTQLNRLKETGFVLFIGLLPIVGGSGSPGRILALQTT